MPSDERLEYLVAFSCRPETTELARDLITARAEIERLRGVWVEGPPKEEGDYWIERNGSIEATNWSANVCGAFCGRSFWEIAILPEEVARHAALNPPTKE